MPFKRNVRTGEIIEVDASGRPVTQSGPPRDPTFDYQAPKARADIAQSQASTQNTYVNARGQEIDNRVKNATAAATIRKANAEARAAELAAGKAQTELNPAADPKLMAGVRDEAQRKIGLIDSLIERSQSWASPMATGFGARTSSLAGGTPAYDQQADADTVSAAGALTRVMELAKENGGKNPLTPLSNTDFAAIGKSVSNLDIAQSDGQFQRNARTMRDIYSRALKGAGGVDTSRLHPTDGMNALQQGYQSLTQRMQGMTPTQRQAALRNYNADPRVQALKARAGFRDPPGNARLRPPPARRGGQPRVIDFNDLP